MRWVLVTLVVLDVGAGTLLLLWPGLWQEVLHPLAMGSTFYPLQRVGAVWLMRALVTLYAVRRPGARWLAAVAWLWAVEVPGDLLLSWRTAGTGPLAAWFYAGRATLAAVVGARAWRAAGGDGDEERDS